MSVVVNLTDFKAFGKSLSLCTVSDGVVPTGHPDGIEAGATANRVAMETVLLARNSGEDFLKNGVAHLKKASEICNPLKKALDTWKDVKFDFESTDTADPRAGNIVKTLSLKPDEVVALGAALQGGLLSAETSAETSDRVLLVTGVDSNTNETKKITVE